MDKLLHCPFCVGKAEILTAESMRGGYLFGIMCNDCCSRGDVYETEAEAIDAWNTRTERTCHADEVTHRNCKYSINRGWRERTCRLVEDSGLLHCSKCGGAAEKQSWAYWNYCPNCGAMIINDK